MLMKVVGVRELKDKLSEYLRAAASGETLLITDRGEVVAELTAPGRGERNPEIPAGLADLAAQGRVRLGARNEGKIYRKLSKFTPRGTAEKLISEDREEP